MPTSNPGKSQNDGGGGAGAPQRETAEERRAREAREESEVRARWENGIPSDIQEKIDREREQIEEFLKKRLPESGYAELAVGGQIFERYSMKEMRSLMQDAIQNGWVNDDNYFLVEYSNGEIVSINDAIASGDAVRMAGIRSIHYTNPMTEAFTGKPPFTSQLEEEAKAFYQDVKEGRRIRADREPYSGDGSRWTIG